MKIEEDLQQAINEVERTEKEYQKKTTEQHDFSDRGETRGVDVLNLPPRKEVHGQKQRAKIKISSSLIRLVLVIMILVVILGGGYYIWGEELIHLFK